MEITEIKARPRDERGSRACSRLRNQNLIPAVLYGRGAPNVLLTLRRADVRRLVEENAVLVQVIWDGQADNAQIKEIQYDALGDVIQHVDLARISLTETVTVNVPVETHGEAAGEAAGGVLELVMRSIEVECLPTAIPDQIDVEVEALEIGDNLTVGELSFPEGVTPVTDAGTVVVTVVPPLELTEEEEEPEELVLEPELIGREVEEPEVPPEEGEAPPREPQQG